MSYLTGLSTLMRLLLMYFINFAFRVHSDVFTFLRIDGGDADNAIINYSALSASY